MRSIAAALEACMVLLTIMVEDSSRQFHQGGTRPGNKADELDDFSTAAGDVMDDVFGSARVSSQAPKRHL